MLLSDYKCKVEVFKCSPHSQEVGCVVELGQDISAAFPYLNAELKRSRYNPEGPTLEINYEDRGVALQARRVAFGAVDGIAEAERVMASIASLINDTWERHNEITPSFRRGPCLSPLDIFQLLPGVNCSRCGEPTCLAFAAKLARENAAVSHCAPLAKSEHAAHRLQLAALLLEAGYEVPKEWLAEPT